MELLLVSIPFNRDGVSKLHKGCSHRRHPAGFYSLQPGRRFQTKVCWERRWKQFLQVSIPFNRDGVSKLKDMYQPEQVTRVSIPFKRDGVSKRMPQMPRTSHRMVSIPFNRDGVSKRVGASPQRNSCGGVSIPFNRDGVSKRRTRSHTQYQPRVFLFPSTGTAFPNVDYLCDSAANLWVFLFPSTGTAFPNYQKVANLATKLSIEFLFPSTGTAFPNSRTIGVSSGPSTTSFYSLQPGRRFQTPAGRFVFL